MWSYFYQKKPKNNSNNSKELERSFIYLPTENNVSTPVVSFFEALDITENYVQQNTVPSQPNSSEAGFIVIPANETSFSIGGSCIPTANARPLSDFSRIETTPLGVSSHPVFKAYYMINGSLQLHYLKEPPSNDMAFVEAFMGQLYEMSLLYGVARATVRYKSGSPELNISSKGITDFSTFKDSNLTAEQLADDSFRTRFLRTLALAFRMMEDDFHRGNLTSPNKSSPGLHFFDADCSFWPVTFLIKGPRPGVDNLMEGYLVVGRNPEVCFFITEEDLQHFPNFVNYNPFYCPSRENPLTEVFLQYVKNVSKAKTNPWTAEDVAKVQQLEKHPDTQPICFEEYIDWMIDISLRFPHIAALNLPDNLMVKSKNQKAIDLYTQLNNHVNKLYWTILPKMDDFQAFMESNKEIILKHILVRTTLRNFRFQQEKDEAINDTERERFSKQFAAAHLDVHHVVKSFDQLIAEINKEKKKNNVVPFEIENDSIPVIQAIDTRRVNELIKEAEETAQQMFEFEKEAGREDWTKFERFDYKFKSQAPAPNEQAKPVNVSRTFRK